ncbi:MAG: hypothetical protein ACJ8AW_29015 [Rhodopila sp.]|jgi:hypothetical protein
MRGDIAETVMLFPPLVASCRVIPACFATLGKKRTVLSQPAVVFVLSPIRAFMPAWQTVDCPPFPARGGHAMFLACSDSIASA